MELAHILVQFPQLLLGWPELCYTCVAQELCPFLGWVEGFTHRIRESSSGLSSPSDYPLILQFSETLISHRDRFCSECWLPMSLQLCKGDPPLVQNHVRGKPQRKFTLWINSPGLGCSQFSYSFTLQSPLLVVLGTCTEILVVI